MPAPLTALYAGVLGLFLLALGFVGARIAHPAGVSRTSKESSGRFWGMAGTWLVIAVLALWDIAVFARAGLGFLR